MSQLERVLQRLKMANSSTEQTFISSTAAFVNTTNITESTTHNPTVTAADATMDSLLHQYLHNVTVSVLNSTLGPPPQQTTDHDDHKGDLSWSNPIVRYFSIVAILGFACVCLLIFHVFIWMDEERKSRQESLKNPSAVPPGRRGPGIGKGGGGKGMQTGFMMKVKR